MKLNKIIVGENYNYIGAFLTLGCNLSCSYCINRHSDLKSYPLMSANQWIEGFNRISSLSDKPITLQGGEPTLHPNFYKIVNGINANQNIDLLTNGQFDVSEFMDNIAPERLRRESVYPSIRISYHPETMSFDDIFNKTLMLHKSGYSVGLYSVDHPLYFREISKAREKCLHAGIIFKTKEFLGEFNGKIYGTLNDDYKKRMNSKTRCNCFVSDFLIAPDGTFYRCHYELYNSKNPLGHILDQDFVLPTTHSLCDSFGKCNPCDIKIKTNRFQKNGHQSANVILE